MNKLLYFFIFIFLTSGCSFNKNSKFWSPSQNIPKEDNQSAKKVFNKEDTFDQEKNPNLKISLKAKLNKNLKSRILFNNDGRLNYNGDLKKSSRYKFSKIKNFYQFEPIILFNKNNIIFFDN